MGGRGERRWQWSVLDMTLVTLVVVCCQAQQQQRFYFKQQDTCPGQVLLEDNCTDSVKTKGKSQCGAECGQRAGCLSFVWDPDTHICRLCNSTVNAQCTNTRPADRQQTLELRCPNEDRTSQQCQCPPAWDGPLCQNRMTDCADWKSAGYSGRGVKWIHPALSPQPFQIMCQMNWNRGLLLYRSTSSLDFYRNWTQYAEGFGDVSGDYWLGLRKIHQLTQSQCYTLAMQLTLANRTYYQRYYRHFTVSSEDQYFTINFDSTFPWTNPLGDCLTDVKQKPFSTYDADHDDDVTGNCAERHHSGWWFGNCTLCNPTGQLTKPANMSRTSESEVFWIPGLDDIMPDRLMMLLLRC